MVLRNAGYPELANRIKEEDKRITVYGAGMIGRIVIPYIVEAYGLQEYVDCFVDSDSRKQGQEILVGSFRYEIRGMEILSRLEKNSVLLITTSRFYQVLDCLDGIPELRDTEAYLVPVMQLEASERAKKFGIHRFLDTPVIPKKIHYCWFSEKPMPLFLQECVQGWRELCPDYEIKEWNEKNYDVADIPYVEEAYKNGSYGFVADVARLDILYQYGGVYLDTDVTLLKSLDELLYQPAFVGVEKWGNINTGGGCGAVAHHPMIREMLEYRKCFHFLQKDGSRDTATNGLYETIPFLRHGMKVDNTMQIINGVTIYPSCVFHPYDYMSCEDSRTEATIAKHHFYGGWMDKQELHDRQDTQRMYRSILKRMKCGTDIA